MRLRWIAPCLLSGLPILGHAAEEAIFFHSLHVTWLWFLGRGLALAVTLLLGILVWLLLKQFLLRLCARAHMLPELQCFFLRGLRWIMITVVGLAVLQQVGVEIGVLWGLISAGIAMIAIGFVAVWSVLSNSTAAFILMMSRPFRIGDLIEVTEATGGPTVKGSVSDIDLVYTTIRERDEEGQETLLRIPNNVLLQKSVRVFPGSHHGEELGTHMSQVLLDQEVAEKDHKTD